MDVTCPCDSSPSGTSSSLQPAAHPLVPPSTRHQLRRDGGCEDSHLCQDVPHDPALLVLRYVRQLGPCEGVVEIYGHAVKEVQLRCIDRTRTQRYAQYFIV